MRQIHAAWQWWLTPLQTDVDAAFRERTLRLAVVLFYLASALQALLFLTTPEIPASSALTLVFSAASAVIAGILIARGRLASATVLLGLDFMLTAGAAQTRQGYWSGYMFVFLAIGVLFSSLVLSRKQALWFSTALIVQYAVIAFWQEQAKVPYPNPLRSSNALSTPILAVIAIIWFGLFTFGLNVYYVREFNRRATNVNELVNTLEARVAARTAELEAANQQLTELATVKDQFVASVSHELRTPITNLKLRYHLIEEQPQLVQQHLDVAKRETDRLARIIDSLLTLSRLDQQRTTFEWRAVDLNALAHEYVEDRAPFAQMQNVTLCAEDHATAPRVRADSDLLGQAVSILLTNALHYTPAGGTVVIQVGARDSDSTVWGTISVIDDGPGISPEDQARLFERFFRGTATENTKAPGTGLGLAILKEIVNRHGGRVEVHSTGVPGEGARFTILLPPAPQEKA